MDRHSMSRPMIGIRLTNLPKHGGDGVPICTGGPAYLSDDPLYKGTLLTHKNALRITIDLFRPSSFFEFSD